MKLIRSFLFHGMCINSILLRVRHLWKWIQLVSQAPGIMNTSLSPGIGSNCPTHIYRVKEINIGIHDHFLHA